MGSVAVRNVYVDYLLSTGGLVSATELSKALDSRYSHDQITRMLSGGDVGDKTLYLKGKKFIEQKGVKGVVTLSIDDSIQLKPHSEVNGLVAYHWDHKEGCTVKGINFVSALFSDDEISVPLSLQVVEKEGIFDEKEGAQKWKVSKSKNQLFREMAERLTRSKKVDYVLSDSWYASKENMQFVYGQCETHFIMALKINRCVAGDKQQWDEGNFKPLEELKLGKRAVKIYLKDLDFPVLLVKKVFKHKDGSSGTLYLATSNLELDYEQIVTLYKRRWKVEEYHKSLKSNCSLGKCQAFSHTAQKSHFYLSALAFLLLEKAKAEESKNHFALMKEINVLSVKFGLKAVKKQLRTTTKMNKMAA